MKLKNLMVSSFIASGCVVIFIVWFGIQEMFLTTSNGYILIGITVFANIIGSLIGLFLLRNTFHSLATLSEQTRQVRKNCFQTITLHKAPEELNRLTDDFNEMVVALSQSFKDLEESEQEKSNMVSQLGHDIKTPITAISSQIEAMQDGIILKEEILDVLPQMMNQVERLRDLTKQLMEVAMVENGTFQSNAQRIQNEVWVDKLLVKILSGFQFKTKKKQQNLCVEMHNAICFKQIDEMSLIRILSNLIDNSIKYSNAGSEIIIAITKSDTHVIFTIKDEGVGIPEEDLPYIFNRLYRVEKSRNQTTGGSGLGLYISKSLAQQLGGTLDVKSTLHVGTSFTLTLPL